MPRRTPNHSRDTAAHDRALAGQKGVRSFGLPYFSVGLQLTEPWSSSLLKAAWAEFVCTLLFLFLSTGCICFGCHSSDISTSSTGDSGGASVTPVDCFLNSSRVQTIATSFGITIFALVYAASPFSGGHLNPAVTAAFLMTKKISLIKAALYWIAQLGGAILGSYLVKYTDLTGFAAANGGANRLLKGLPPSAGWLLECVLTFSLIFVIFIATDQKRAQSTPHLPILAPAAIGFVVFACHLAAVAIDGCSINPARSFGPAVTAAYWTHHWVFWVGPMSGALIAALVYELTFRPSHDPILSVDRHDSEVRHPDQEPANTKLPGYTGAGGLTGGKQARNILAARRFGDSADGTMGGIPEDGAAAGWDRPHPRDHDLMSTRHSDLLGSRSHMLDGEEPSDQAAFQHADGHHAV